MTADIYTIISRYLSGEAIMDDIVALGEWLQSDENNKCKLAQLKKFWTSPVELTDLEDLDVAFGKFLKRIDSPIPAVSPPENAGIAPRRRRVAISVIAAASVALLAGISLICIFTGTECHPVEHHTYTCGNGVDRLMLPDSTVVYLNKDSRISYTNGFGKERRVSLDGEAYFDVKKGLGTFTVDVDGGASVEVLGTRFNLKAFSGEGRVVTTLEEGSVRFVRGEREIVLVPDQQLVYNMEAPGYDIRTVDPDGYTAWKEHMFKYSRIAMSDLCRELECIYGVDIDLNPALKGITVSGSFEYRHEIERILNVMEKRMRFKWTRKGDIITIQ